LPAGFSNQNLSLQTAHNEKFKYNLKDYQKTMTFVMQQYDIYLNQNNSDLIIFALNERNKWWR